MPRLLAAAAAAALCLGCASAQFRRAEAKDNIDAWRAFLASHPDVGSEIDHARERLEALSWEATEAANTPRAYRQFVEDFPSSDHAEEAQGRLAALRYQKAAHGAESGLSRFLEEEPTGPLAAEARGKLADLEFGAAVKTKGLAPIELYLARFPEGPHLAEARALADARAFEDASRRGILGLTEYVKAHPDGAHRGEAEDRLLAARLAALVDEERFDEAEAVRKAAASHPSSTFGGSVWTKLAEQIEAGKRRARLAAVEPMTGLPRAALEKLQEAAFGLARPDRAAVAQLAAGLEDPDPARRWLSARELGATGSIWALDPLLASASGSRFWKVRLAAARAVRELASGWPEVVRQEEVARRVLELRPLVASAELSDRLGLLEEAGGDASAARAAFAQARRWSPTDLLALREGMRLAREAGDQGTHLALARDLVEGTTRYADDRLRDEGFPALLADRQLCGLAELARDGVGAVAAAGAEGKAWLPRLRARADHVDQFLVEAERRAAQEDPAFTACAAPAGADLVAAAVARRLSAVAALAERHASGLEAEVVRAVLEEAAAHDGSRRVREAAEKALAGL